jgi:hypothetical protein
MTHLEMISKLSDGWTASAFACLEIISATRKVCPDTPIHSPLFMFDEIGLYGARIGFFYERVCDKNTTTALGVLYAARLKFIRYADIHTAIDDASKPLPLISILARVKGRLPLFGLEMPSPENSFREEPRAGGS